MAKLYKAPGNKKRAGVANLESGKAQFKPQSIHHAKERHFLMLKATILDEKRTNKNTRIRASLVAQWLRICLPMQGTRVRALVWEDPTCHGATKPVCHNY